VAAKLAVPRTVQIPSHAELPGGVGQLARQLAAAPAVPPTRPRNSTAIAAQLDGSRNRQCNTCASARPRTAAAAAAAAAAGGVEGQMRAPDRRAPRVGAPAAKQHRNSSAIRQHRIISSVPRRIISLLLVNP
jgi:hypothetical protein